jgi:uncharacterized protein YegP (UPF0339 family)
MQHDIGMSTIRVKELADFNSNIAVKELPKVFLDSNVDMNTDNAIRIKEIPEVRTHLPAHYNLGFKLFGVEIASISLCGEGQVITEKYRPNRYERCEKTVCGEPVATRPAVNIEIYRDRAEQYRWRILEKDEKSETTEIIGASAQGFKSKNEVLDQVRRLNVRGSEVGLVDNSGED